MWGRRAISASILVSLALAPATLHSQAGSLLPTSGPGGGPVRDLVLATDGDLFAFAGGLHLSTDAGWSWNAVPAAPGTSRLAAGRAADLWAWGSGGLFLTSDDGVNWTLLSSAPSEIHELAFATAQRVFAGTSHGLFVSLDAGVTWTQVTEVPSIDVAAVVATPGLTSAAAGNTIYRSEDGGASWTLAAELPRNITALAVHPDGGYYAGVEPRLWTLPVGGVYRVHPDGTAALNGLESHDIEHILVRSDGLVLAGSAGWSDGYNPFGMGIYRSNDGNDPYQAVACGGYVNALVCDAGDQVFAAMDVGFTDIGALPACGVVVTSGPGTDWVRRNRDLGRATIFDLAASESGVVYAAADWTVAWTEDEGTSWNEIETPLPEIWPEEGTWQLAAHPDGTLFAANPSTLLHRSTDRGRTWTTSNSVFGSSAVTVTVHGVVWVGTRQGEIWRSLDRGDTWSLVATEENHDPIVETASGPLGAVALATPTVILVVAADGSWVTVLPTTGRIAFAPDERALYVADGNEVQRWVEAPGGWVQESMPTFLAEDVAVDRDGRVYGATRTSVAWTTPGDPVWHALGSTPSQGWYLGQRARLVLASDGHLYFGTSNDGVYRSSTPARSPAAVGDFDGEPLASWNCAPNPARRASTVTFGLARSSLVHVSVYDVRGRLVATLADGREFAPGLHALQWIPAAGTASGVYTYRLQAGEVERGGRIVFIR